jgi:large subunit ribosomal protein L22
MAAVEDKIEFRAQARWVRTAPRKAQLVVEEIRGRTVPEAQVILAFMTRAAAKDVASVLNSAVANAESHPLSSYSGDDLYVSAAEVGSGPTLKRWRARARGRVGRIKKRTCHITIRLEPIEAASPQSGRAAAAAEGRQAAEKPRAAGPASAQSRRAAAAAEGRQAAEEPRVEVELEPEAAVVEEPAVELELEPEPEAQAVEEPAEQPPAEEKPKPARARKKAEPVTEEAPAAKKPTTRKPAAKKPAAEQPAAEEKPKPTRARKKADEPAPESPAGEES